MKVPRVSVIVPTYNRTAAAAAGGAFPPAPGEFSREEPAGGRRGWRAARGTEQKRRLRALHPQPGES